MPFDDDAALLYSEWRADLARLSTPIGKHDLEIADIALTNDPPPPPTAQLSIANIAGPSTVKAPKQRKEKRNTDEPKPPSIKGIEWSKNRSGGWDCRTFRELPDGTITNRQYLGYLGKRKWDEMRSQMKGEALRSAIEKWLQEKIDGKPN